MAEVELLRHPTDEDWQRCKMLAMNTIGRKWSGEVSDEWKRRILKAEHSPIRTLWFTVRMELPYWVSTHFVRHKYGVEHYVSSQRNDRQSNYDRNKATQDAQVTHIMDINAQELIQMARMRLCGQASVETRLVMTLIRDAVIETNPEFADFIKPKCEFMGECNEFKSCGRVSSRFVRLHKSKPVIVTDESTDCATGYCTCGECGRAVDFWDKWCRWCGARIGDADDLD